MDVQDAIAADVVVVGPSQTLCEAARLMVDRRVGAVIVVDDTLPVPGIITERDIMRAVADGANLATTRVTEWMTFEARTSGADWDLDQAASAMIHGQFRHLVVVDDRGHLASVISMRDIVRAYVAGSKASIDARARSAEEELTGSPVRSIPASSGRPRAADEGLTGSPTVPIRTSPGTNGHQSR